MPFRYRLVKDINPVQVTPEIEGYPADGFATAKEAEAWAVAHQLDWRWNVRGVGVTKRGQGSQWYIDAIPEAEP